MASFIVFVVVKKEVDTVFLITSGVFFLSVLPCIIVHDIPNIYYGYDYLIVQIIFAVGKTNSYWRENR